MGLLLGFSVLFLSSLLLGLTIVLMFAAIRAMRSNAPGTAGRDLRPLFPALFASTGLLLLLSLPPILAAVRASLPAFIVFGLVSAAAIAFWRKRRGVVRGGVAASCLFAGAIVLFVFALFRFLTAAMSPLEGETLAALVEVEGTKLDRDVTVEKGPATLTIHAGSPAVRLTLTPMDDDEQAGPLQFELPGEKWGVGGEVLEVKNWLLFFGTRAFFRLTHVDAKFVDNEIPHYGKNLPGFDPADTTARLEAKVPLIERTVRDLCGARVESTRYEDVVYRRVDEGRFYALVARDQGGFVPRPITEAEYRRQLGPRAGQPHVVP